jgi:hypothetical protein
MISLFLSGMVAMIMIRTLRSDLMRYNALELDDAADAEAAREEETGWKLVHTDVFRPPAHGGSLTVLVGTGCQVFAMTLITMSVAVLGMLSPANRGGLLTALVMLFVFMGAFAGTHAMAQRGLVCVWCTRVDHISCFSPFFFFLFLLSSLSPHSSNKNLLNVRPRHQP